MTLLLLTSLTSPFLIKGTRFKDRHILDIGQFSNPLTLFNICLLIPFTLFQTIKGSLLESLLGFWEIVLLYWLLKKTCRILTVFWTEATVRIYRWMFSQWTIHQQTRSHTRQYFISKPKKDFLDSFSTWFSSFTSMPLQKLAFSGYFTFWTHFTMLSYLRNRNLKNRFVRSKLPDVMDLNVTPEYMTEADVTFLETLNTLLKSELRIRCSFCLDPPRHYGTSSS